MYETIARLCAEKGITIAAMCREIDLQQSVISDIRNGRAKKLSISEVVTIADYLGVTVDVLIGSYVEFLAGLPAGLPQRDQQVTMQKRVDKDADILMEIMRRYQEMPDGFEVTASEAVQAATALAGLAKITMK